MLNLILKKLLGELLAESKGKGRLRNTNRGLQTLILLALLVLGLETKRDVNFLFDKMGFTRPPSILSLSSLLASEQNNKQQTTNNYAHNP